MPLSGMEFARACGPSFKMVMNNVVMGEGSGKYRMSLTSWNELMYGSISYTDRYHILDASIVFHATCSVAAEETRLAHYDA
jgi:hypothetical protein